MAAPEACGDGICRASARRNTSADLVRLIIKVKMWLNSNNENCTDTIKQKSTCFSFFYVRIITFGYVIITSVLIILRTLLIPYVILGAVTFG
jgi:hypothetical protein